MDEKFLFISRKWIKTLFEATFLKNPTNPFSIAMIILIFVANVISFEIKNVCVRSDYLSCFHVILSYVKCLMLILGTCLFSCVSSKVIVSHACIYHITYRTDLNSRLYSNSGLLHIKAYFSELDAYLVLVLVILYLLFSNSILFQLRA